MNQSAMVAVPCLVTVAAGVFASGHLGELTRYLLLPDPGEQRHREHEVHPDARGQRPHPLLHRPGHLQHVIGQLELKVWDKMTAALEDLGLPRPSEKALRDLRRRLGPAPAKALFETVAVPLASPWTRGVTWRGLHTVASGGLNSVKVPDSDRNRCWLGKLKNRLGLAGYPAMRIVALAETGTRGLLGAVIGGIGERAEVPLARKLVTLLGEGMLLLADRAYDARKRREQAARDARVQRWGEDSGNAALTGRELPPAEVLAAGQRITAWARELKKAGLDGSMDELRARAY